MAENVGSLSSIARYPIKSFQGESIMSSVLQEQGIFADRPLALLDKASGNVLSGNNRRVPKSDDPVISSTLRYTFQHARSTT